MKGKDLNFFREYKVKKEKDITKMNFMKITFGMGESDLIQIAGTDQTLFTKYLKYNSVMFLAFSILNCSVLMPTYLSGDPVESEDGEVPSHFSRFTIANILSKPKKLWVSFAMVILNSAIAYFTVYRFKTTSQHFKQKKNNKMKLTNNDIKLHTILIRGIPTDLDPQKASNELKKIFKRSMKEQIVNIRVVGNYSKEYSIGQKWMSSYKQMIIYKIKNEILAYGKTIRRITISQKRRKCLKWLCPFSCCRCCEGEVEAQKYYEKEMDQCIRNICRIQKKKPKNIGCAFLVLQQTKHVTELLSHKNILKQRLNRTELEDKKYKIYKWKLEQAPAMSDIRWTHLNQKDIYSLLKKFVLLALIIVILLLVVTPATVNIYLKLIQFLMIAQPLARNIEEQILSKTKFASMLSRYLLSLMSLLSNFIIAPEIIELFILGETIETKSDLHITTMYRIFIFLTITYIFLPMANYFTIFGYLEQAVKEITKENFYNYITQNMGSVTDYYLQQGMDFAFVSTSIILLDLAHNAIIVLKKLFRFNKAQPFKDTWYFDLGYHQARAMVVAEICLIFSVSVPILNLFAAVFFAIFYYALKYNIIYVYKQEFESKGKQLNSFTSLAIASILTFQIMNYLYEYAYIKKNFFTGIAMALIINQLMAWMVTSVFKFFKKKNNKAKAAEEQHFSLVLRKKDLVKLEMAYRHPWEKLKPFIDTYYLNNLLEKPDNYIIQEQFDIQGQNQSIGHTRDVKLIIHQPMNPPEDFIQKQISSPKHPLEEQAPPRVPNHPDINDLDEKIFGAKFQLKRSLSFSYHKGGISNKRKLALLFMNDKEKFQYEKLTSGKTRGINESQSVHNERTDPKFYAGKNISEFSLIDSEKDALEWEQQLDG